MSLKRAGLGPGPSNPRPNGPLSSVMIRTTPSSDSMDSPMIFKPVYVTTVGVTSEVGF